MIVFGVFGDAHYAPGKTYGKRHCGLSLEKLKNCIGRFKSVGADFAVNLGDVIDSTGSKERDIENLMQIKDVFSEFDGRVVSTIGNHDIEAMSKGEFIGALGKDESKPYYSFDIGCHHFMVLDACFRTDGVEYCGGNYSWDDSFIPEHEMQWIARDLTESACENAVVFIHQNLDVRENDAHIVNNAGEIRKIFEASGKNIAVFQGHYHRGDSQKINGIDYVTLKAMCEGEDTRKFPYMILGLEKSGEITVIEAG